MHLAQLAIGKRAEKHGATYALILGENEKESGTITFKYLKDATQKDQTWPCRPWSRP